MRENRIWTLTFLALLAIVCASALAVVNLRLGPIIARNDRIRLERIILNLFALRYDPFDLKGIETTYAQHVEEHTTNGILTYTEKWSGRKAIRLEGSGFQGPIRVVAALDDGTITAFRVVDQIETPGLGSRIADEDFQRSFAGKRVENGIRMVKINAGESEFDAITGATETSRALERLLNRGFSKYFGPHGAGGDEKS